MIYYPSQLKKSSTFRNFYFMKLFATILTAVGLCLAAAGEEKMPKSRYIDLMEKVLSAYSNEHILRYYNDVQTNGLKEHGFPRLTADIGILIAHGRRTDLKDQFVKMMDLCCREIPAQNIAANEFTIKEMVFVILELEKHQTFPAEQIARWKNAMKEVELEKCYRNWARQVDSKVNNWAAFTMTSEWMRYYIKAAELDQEFIDRQAAALWQYVDCNGMFRDPNEPMVYDMVTRGLFAVMLHFNYRGKYAEMWDDALKRTGLLNLKMLSVNGEIPYGGRSNQFLHNESHSALLMEFEAVRYAKLGDMKKAAQFKAAAKRSLDNMAMWLEQKPINHVKNAFPRSTQYGCENYAYFDKYMITAASFLYVAYLFCDENIPVGELDHITGDTWQTSEHFHKLFMRAGDYFAEYDYRADYKYDSSGLGRLHYRNAPGTIALSTPGTDKPGYTINAKNAVAFAIAPEVMHNGKWLSGADAAASHKIVKHGSQGESAFAVINCTWQDNVSVQSTYKLDKNGMLITVEGKDAVGLMLPAFEFDGKVNPAIANDGKTLTVTYKNYVCIYQAVNGTIRDTGRRGYNRNGHYKLFRAEGSKSLTVRITIQPVAQ